MAWSDVSPQGRKAVRAAERLQRKAAARARAQRTEPTDPDAARLLDTAIKTFRKAAQATITDASQNEARSPDLAWAVLHLQALRSVENALLKAGRELPLETTLLRDTVSDAVDAVLQDLTERAGIRATTTN